MVFTEDQRDAFFALYPTIYDKAFNAMEGMKEKVRKQPRNVKEEDKLFPADIHMSMYDAMEKALKPWVASLPSISPSQLTEIKHIEGELHRCIYNDFPYLFEHVSSISTVDKIVTMLSLGSIQSQLLLKPIFVYKLSEDRDGMWRKGELIVFYENYDDVKAPFDLNEENVAYMTYIFAVLWNRDIDVRGFDVFYMDGEFKLHVDIAYSTTSNVLSYKNSIRYMMDDVEHDIDERDRGKIKKFYAHEIAKYSDVHISDENMVRLFECMAEK
jgi:hypothetical protein